VYADIAVTVKLCAATLKLCAAAVKLCAEPGMRCSQVQLWDVGTQTMVREYEAHERRVWSVDFNSICTHMFASGSDDGTVKVCVCVCAPGDTVNVLVSLAKCCA
jgi:hypothetical protein